MALKQLAHQALHGHDGSAKMDGSDPGGGGGGSGMAAGASAGSGLFAAASSSSPGYNHSYSHLLYQLVCRSVKDILSRELPQILVSFTSCLRAALGTGIHIPAAHALVNSLEKFVYEVGGWVGTACCAAGCSCHPGRSPAFPVLPRCLCHPCRSPAWLPFLCPDVLPWCTCHPCHSPVPWRAVLQVLVQRATSNLADMSALAAHDPQVAASLQLLQSAGLAPGAGQSYASNSELSMLLGGLAGGLGGGLGQGQMGGQGMGGGIGQGMGQGMGGGMGQGMGQGMSQGMSQGNGGGGS